MFFILSKVLAFFASPSNLMIALGLLGVLLLGTRLARLGARLSAASLIALAVCGLSPLGNALIIPLEQRFPPWRDTHGAPDGIVVLGGAITPDVSEARNDVALNEAAERVTAAVALARRYPDARIIAEEQSRNTVENAVFSRLLAMPQPGERWLLVTSGYHMPRAIGVFRRVGFPVEAYPVDWRTRGPQDMARPFPTLGSGLERTDTAAREWVGLLIYWLTGRSAALFPAPLDPG